MSDSVFPQAFELATGDYLFEPHSGEDYSRDEGKHHYKKAFWPIFPIRKEVVAGNILIYCLIRFPEVFEVSCSRVAWYKDFFIPLFFPIREVREIGLYMM